MNYTIRKFILSLDHIKMLRSDQISSARNKIEELLTMSMTNSISRSVSR